MKRSSDKYSATPRADDLCPNCGATMTLSTLDLPTIVNGEALRIASVEHLRCPTCNEVLLSQAQAKALQQRGVEAYRENHALLAADEIRALRQKHGLTQAELAAVLQLGMNTVSRWESGRNVQNGAMDLLLRLLRDVPGTRDYLEKRAA
jgi:putative zinc finger/helix-turn-helix YgiT family protein